MGSFVFWQRWLVAACFVFAAVGVLVALANDSFLFARWNAGVDATFAENATLGPEAAALKAFLLGPLGGTILGSYVLCGAIAAGPFARREPWAWWAITASLLAWFLLDSAVSIRHGAWFNVLQINALTLVGQGLPLVATAKVFLAPRERSASA